MKKYALVVGGQNFAFQLVSELSKNFTQFIPIQCSAKITNGVNNKNFFQVSLADAFSKITNRFPKMQVSLITNSTQDKYVQLYSQLVDYYKLPGPSSKSMKFFKNKAVFHNTVVTIGLGSYRPQTLVVPLSKVKELKKIQYPMIVKPYIGAHSRGITKVNSHKEFDQAISKVIAHYQSEDTISLNKETNHQVLLEEFIQGTQITSCAYVDRHGRVHQLCLLDMIRASDLSDNHFQIIYRTTPSSITESVEKQMTYILQKIINYTGLKSTFIDPEFIEKNGKVYLIELNARLGGFRHFTLNYAYGINPARISIDLALNKRVSEKIVHLNSCTACEIWHDSPGVLKEIVIPDHPNVKSHHFNIHPGMSYQPPPVGNKSFGSLYVVSNKDSLKAAKEIRSKVKIIFVDK